MKGVQPSALTREHLVLKNMKFLDLLQLLWVIFVPVRIQIQPTKSMWLGIRILNTDAGMVVYLLGIYLGVIYLLFTRVPGILIGVYNLRNGPPL